tara:strand:- start:245 stop:763 length:519 start_codon:yes stop_codon:yes gene_type:complete
MADFKINGVTFASESGGTVSLSNANIFPVGHIINFVTATSSTEVISDSTTNWVNTLLSAQITPTYENSKIFVLCTFSIASNNPNYLALKVDRTGPSTVSLGYTGTYISTGFVNGATSYSGLDSPGTKSQLCTYTLWFYATSNAAGQYFNYDSVTAPGETSPSANMILMEIKQ